MSNDTINPKLRKLLIKRVDGICAICLKRPFDLDAHRIIPGREGGKHNEDNVIMVCPECHRIIDKQVGLRRLLVDLKESLEWILFQHRFPGKKIRINEIRDQWECRRIKSSKDHLLESILKLFEEFREDENEDLSSIGVWLDDMITWRRICTGLLNLCSDNKTELNQIFARLKKVLDLNEDDPRFYELMKNISNINNKEQLYTFIKYDILKLEDYLIVQRNEDRAVGFIYYHYYYKHKYAFVSYVVLAKPNGITKSRAYQSRSLDRLVYNGLLKNLIKNHPECKGIVMEIDPAEGEIVENVDHDIIKKLQSKRGRGLYRLFHMRYPMLKRIDIKYIQPKSFIHSERDEKELWLLYYPLRSTNTDYIKRNTLSKILDCIYNYVYCDELDNLSEFDPGIYMSYKNYLSDLRNKIVNNSKSKIALL